MVEHVTRNDEIVGSIPTAGFKTKVISHRLSQTKKMTPISRINTNTNLNAALAGDKDISND